MNLALSVDSSIDEANSSIETRSRGSGSISFKRTSLTNIESLLAGDTIDNLAEEHGPRAFCVRSNTMHG